MEKYGIEFHKKSLLFIEQHGTFLTKVGVNVYIKLSPEGLVDRLKNEKSKRPLIANLTDAELLLFALVHDKNTTI